jgi:hypothetical protein
VRGAPAVIPSAVNLAPVPDPLPIIASMSALTLGAPRGSSVSLGNADTDTGNEMVEIPFGPSREADPLHVLNRLTR